MLDNRNRTRSLFVILSLLAAASLPVLAAAESYDIDPAHSQVSFKIRHFVSRVPGRFDKFSGSISVDPADLSSGKVKVEIEASSVDTDNEKRDTHLKSADFFDVEKFPKITFESTGVTVNAKDKISVAGNLTIRGVTKPVTLDVEVLGFAPDLWGNTRGGFEAHTTINRKEFGVLWNKALDTGGLMLGDDVDLILNVEAVKPAPKPAGK